MNLSRGKRKSMLSCFGANQAFFYWFSRTWLDNNLKFCNLVRDRWPSLAFQSSLSDMLTLQTGSWLAGKESWKTLLSKTCEDAELLVWNKYKPIKSSPRTCGLLMEGACIKQHLGVKITRQLCLLESLLTDNRLYLKLGMYKTPCKARAGLTKIVPEWVTEIHFPLGKVIVLGLERAL